jgi:cellulose synthase/poly-beta-1,6-N-acetylglucosamine synthase-like glycosyltransferase
MTATVTTVDMRGLALLLLDAAILAVVVLRPMSRNYDDSDQGSGSLVLMVPPLRPSYARCASFLAVSFLVSVLLVGLRSPTIVDDYYHLVEQLLLSVVPQPALVDAYVHQLPPVFQVSVIASGVALAVCFRASLARRFMIMVNIAILLVVSAVADVFLGVFVLTTGLPLGPTPVIALLIQYGIAGLVVFRLAFTTFQLPKKTPFPLHRGHDWSADIILGVCMLAAVAVVSCMAAYLIRHFGQNSLIMVAIVISCGPYALRLIVVFLGLVRLVHHRPVALSDQRPPIEIITPAFNEEINIVDLLESIDQAAEFYGGPVRAIICDDGSTDDTVALGEAAIARLRFATGEIVHGGHHGKSAALNQALSRGTAEYVFRVDADCIVDRKAFAYSVSYFLSDPQIGMVGAFTLPREPYATWIDRARLFELVVNFGLVRPATDVVDGISCVPGTFTGFRRAPAEQIGGFVDGMYGEDQDFTAGITRLGYRVQLDTRIRSFEDVPNTQRQLRAQRTRWNRGSTMSFARFVPVATGLSGPRFWFFGARSTGQRLLTPLRLAIIMYIIAESLIQPSGKINLAHLVIILALRVVPQLVFVIGCCLYYGKARDLLWLPVELPFAMLKHYYSLESLLSFNARPVLTARMADEIHPITKPAVVEPVAETPLDPVGAG